MSIKPNTFYVLERGTYYEKNVLCNVCSRRSSIFSRMYKDGHSSYHGSTGSYRGTCQGGNKSRGEDRNSSRTGRDATTETVIMPA